MFLPANRHLLVQPVSFGKGAPDADASGVLLPDGYVPVKEFETAEVLLISEDCQQFSEDSVGHYVVFPGNMMKTVLVGEEAHVLVQENYIMGVYVPEGRRDD
tara:strand:+ start:431 stop:736 length:306 start_codon:yes stop_codon:yes gene_type:complete